MAIDPTLELRLRQLARELAPLGKNLWELIDSPEDYAAAGRVQIVWDEFIAFGTADGDMILSNARFIYGFTGDDVLLVGGFNYVTSGQGYAGDDLMAGWVGADTLAGGWGDDTILGGEANDALLGGSGSNLLLGGRGDDVIDTRSWTAWEGGERGALADWAAAKRLASDEMHGGEGNDTLEASYGSDLLYGDGGDDWLRGQDGDDLLDGGVEDDALRGDNGADTLLGGDGQDEGRGGLGADLLDGGAGRDTLAGGNGDDTLAGGADRDHLSGGYGADLIEAGEGADWVDAGGDADVIRLGAGDDRAVAFDDFGRGDDLIFGEDGDDFLHGGRGADTLDGGEGDDRLIGAAGDDRLTGGAGADVFEIRGAFGVETITDFDASDRLAIGQGINGLGTIAAEDLIDRVAALGEDAWLDLGGGNGVRFLGVAADELAGLLATNLDFV